MFFLSSLASCRYGRTGHTAIPVSPAVSRPPGPKEGGLAGAELGPPRDRYEARTEGGAIMAVSPGPSPSGRKRFFLCERRSRAR
jgi:hypothetical protein